MIGQERNLAQAGQPRVILTTPSSFSDSVDQTLLTINGYQVPRANAAAVLRMQLGAGCTRMTVFINNNITVGSMGIGLAVDGVHSVISVAQVETMQIATVAVDPSAARLVEITHGLCADGTKGSYVYAVSCDGGSVEVLPNPSVSRRLVILGDSISIGAGTTALPTDGFVQRLRLVYPGRISVEGWGGAAFCVLNGLGSVAALAARLVSLCFDATTREIWDEMTFNDWANVDWSDIADYTASVAALYDAIHALDPTVHIYSQTPLITWFEATENANGQLIGDFRTAKQAAASGRSWVTSVDGSVMVNSANLMDGVHPNTDGQAEYAAAAADILEV